MQPRFCVIACATTTMLLCAGGTLILDAVNSKAHNTQAVGSELSIKISNVLSCVVGYFARIPDELELTHRYEI
jgi:hypothetical protein